MLFFLEPVMQMLAAETRFPQVIALSGFITVMAGLGLYGLMHGFDPAILFDPKLPLALGALAGILAFFTGSYFQGRSIKQLEALGATFPEKDLGHTVKLEFVQH